MELREREAYAGLGLDVRQLDQLSTLGDLLLGSRDNVSGIKNPAAVEHHHFLDSLSLLSLPPVRAARRLVDVGSGGGLPALVLAISLPHAQIAAIESVGKKCSFIEAAAATLAVRNVEVYCERAEELGREHLRATYDVVVSRALSSLPVVLEYSLPLAKQGGLVVAMKGALSYQELIRSERAAAILGGGPVQSRQMDPFPAAQNRWFHIVEKLSETPRQYPRRSGQPAKRPLGDGPREGSR